MIEAGLARIASVRMVTPIAIFLGAVALFGAKGHSVVTATLLTARVEFRSVFIDGFHAALGMTTLGLGTGADTNATRYAFSSPNQFTGVAGRGTRAGT